MLPEIKLSLVGNNATLIYLKQREEERGSHLKRQREEETGHKESGTAGGASSRRKAQDGIVI